LKSKEINHPELSFEKKSLDSSKQNEENNEAKRTYFTPKREHRQPVQIGTRRSSYAGRMEENKGYGGNDEGKSTLMKSLMRSEFKSNRIRNDELVLKPEP
jgi:hypothetical protein